MICMLGPVGCGCPGLDKEGNCVIYLDEGVANNMDKGSCVYKNYRAPNIGIYKPKKSRFRNPLKAAKAEKRAQAQAQAQAKA